MLQRRMGALFCVFGLLYALCLGRLGYIQLFQHKELTYQAVRQRNDRLVIDYNIGKVLDRHGISLEKTPIEQRLLVYPSVIRAYGLEKAVFLLTQYSHLPRVEVLRLLGNPRPFIWPETLGLNDYRHIIGAGFPGLMVSGVRPLLIDHLLPGQQFLAGHTLGYYRDGQAVAGLSKAYQHWLQSPGPYELGFALNGWQQPIPTLGWRFINPPTPVQPYHLTTTLERSWQEMAENRLTDFCTAHDYPWGSVVILHAASGQLRTIASYPPLYGHSDNLTIPHSYINHALVPQAPGSIFKTVVAAAALDKGVVEALEIFVCEGHLDYGDTVVYCMGRRGHGEITFADAYAMSCNTTFVRVLSRLGSGVVMDYAGQLGLGSPTYLGLPDEREGNLPSISASNEYDPNHAIGQGQIATTPLQIARMMSIIVNGGQVIEPYLLTHISDNQGNPVQTYRAGRTRVTLAPFTADALVGLLQQAVEEGTGQGALIPGYTVIGKTGSAQWVQQTAQGVEKGVDGWFAGAIDHPLLGWVVVVVHIRDGQSGSASAIPVFSDIAKNILGLP